MGEKLEGSSLTWRRDDDMFNVFEVDLNRSHHGAFIWCRVDQDFFNLTETSDDYLISVACELHQTLSYASELSLSQNITMHNI